jgi:hypothetical protein
MRPATAVGTDGKDVLVGTKARTSSPGSAERIGSEAQGTGPHLPRAREQRPPGGGGNDRLKEQKGRRDLCIGGAGRDRARCERKRGVSLRPGLRGECPAELPGGGRTGGADGSSD